MPLLLFHVLLVAVSLAAYGGEVAAIGQTYRNNPIICHKSLPCGGHVDVHYPFFLATNASLPTYCGYPGMAVTCDGDCAILRLNGHSYTILDISYENHAVMLVDRDVLNGGDCPRVTHNVTVVPPGTRLINLSPTANDRNLLFFFDCVFTAGTPPPPGIPPINCSGFPGGRGVSFVALESDVEPKDEWPRACETAVVVPVLKDWLPSPEYHPQLNGDGYGQILKRGFQLSWEPGTGPCYACEQTKGKCSYNQSGGFVGCVCSDGCVRDSDCGHGSSKKRYITYMVSAISGAMLLSLLLCMCAMYSKRTQTIESLLQKHEAPYLKRYTYSEVKTLTESFAHKLGKGGFGTVYRGSLPNGRLVAVKLLNNSKDDDGQEFINEVASIMRTSHVNVVTLLGCCFQGPKRALIYEYMPNGSLDRFAFGQNSKEGSSLSWERLFDIAVGIARGLEYLHRWCGTHIVHFDIKPHNILLDQDFCPKISDFGLAKLCMSEESIISINGARGTIGYIAPEVFSPQFGQISCKSDVYSYGMMILEMVGARKNNINCSDSSSKYFPQWVYDHLEEYCMDTGEISVDNEIVKKLIIIGLCCIQLQPNDRPSMSRVVQMLESRVDDLQIPPQTFL